MSTSREGGSDIPSGVKSGTNGTTRDGGDIASGFGGVSSGTSRDEGSDIGSGVHNPSSVAILHSINTGDSLEINSITYQVKKVISKNTGEAKIFLLLRGDKKCVFKLYNSNIKPKEVILEKLKQLNHDDIINLLDYGYYHDHFFEIMDYAKGGAVAEYLPIKDMVRLKGIITETVNAFKYFHANDIVHTDIKPENLYFKHVNGTDILVGDFGISTALDPGQSRRLTAQRFTAGYAAPEMYGVRDPGDGEIKQIVGIEADYYALGITLIHIWDGKSPFQGLGDHAICDVTKCGLVRIPKEMPSEVQTLIKGLITINYTERWGYDEIKRWLNGEDVPVHFHIKETLSTSFKFDLNQDVEAASPNELADLLKGYPVQGKKQLYKGRISAWAYGFDHLLATKLDQIIEEDYPNDQDAGRQKAIYLLNQNEPYSKDGSNECNTSQELAGVLDDGFSIYKKSLANPNHPFYLYLETHKAQKEADAFRAIFKTFSPDKALNTVILELLGRDSITIQGQTFTTPAEVLQTQDLALVANELKDVDSRLSVWMEGAASPNINSQLDAWRMMNVCDAATLALVSEEGGGPPKIKLSTNSFRFTDLKFRKVVTDKFDIINEGGHSLIGKITTDKRWLKLGENKIDSTRKNQTITFSIDTKKLALGATDVAVIEIQSNAGTEKISVAITVEFGAGTTAQSSFQSSSQSASQKPAADSAFLSMLSFIVGIVGFFLLASVAGQTILYLSKLASSPMIGSNPDTFTDFIFAAIFGLISIPLYIIGFILSIPLYILGGILGINIWWHGPDFSNSDSSVKSMYESLFIKENAKDLMVGMWAYSNGAVFTFKTDGSYEMTIDKTGFKGKGVWGVDKGVLSMNSTNVKGVGSSTWKKVNVKLKYKINYIDSNKYIMKGILHDKNTYTVKRIQLLNKTRTSLKNTGGKLEKYSLTVNKSPSDATVRILNINPVYHDGIKLVSGRYHIEVSKSGFKTYKKWVDISNSNVSKSVTLLPVKNTIPKTFLGNWRGEGKQNTGESWSLELLIDKDLVSIKYPSLSCSGNWQPVKYSKTIMQFRENIQFGKNCVNGGSVVLSKINDNKLEYTWYYPSQKFGGSGFLTKKM